MVFYYILAHKKRIFMPSISLATIGHYSHVAFRKTATVLPLLGNILLSYELFQLGKMASMLQAQALPNPQQQAARVQQALEARPVPTGWKRYPHLARKYLARALVIAYKLVSKLSDPLPPTPTQDNLQNFVNNPTNIPLLHGKTKLEKNLILACKLAIWFLIFLYLGFWLILPGVLTELALERFCHFQMRELPKEFLKIDQTIAERGQHE